MRTSTPIEVDEGEIEVTGRTADVVHRYPRLALLEVDLGSKYADLLASSSGDMLCPMVMLQATPRTLGVVKEREGRATVVHFPAFLGWDVAVTSVSRYTLVVCLVKREGRER